MLGISGISEKLQGLFDKIAASEDETVAFLKGSGVAEEQRIFANALGGLDGESAQASASSMIIKLTASAFQIESIDKALATLLREGKVGLVRDTLVNIPTRDSYITFGKEALQAFAGLLEGRRGAALQKAAATALRSLSNPSFNTDRLQKAVEIALQSSENDVVTEVLSSMGKLDSWESDDKKRTLASGTQECFARILREGSYDHKVLAAEALKDVSSATVDTLSAQLKMRRADFDKFIEDLPANRSALLLATYHGSDVVSAGAADAGAGACALWSND